MGKEEKTLEQGFEALGDIIGRMEAKEISLEESFDLYKKGMDELKFCAEKIETTQKAVMQISASGELLPFSEE